MSSPAFPLSNLCYWGVLPRQTHNHHFSVAILKAGRQGFRACLVCNGQFSTLAKVIVTIKVTLLDHYPTGTDPLALKAVSTGAMSAWG